MIANLSALLAQRSSREQLMLALLLWLVVPVAFVGLVLLPLSEQRRTARAALAEATATQTWYLARQADIAALPVADAQVPDPKIEAVGLGGIEARLIDAGLRGAVTLLANTQGDNVSLTLANVPFEGLMQWIELLEADAGYTLAALQIERGEDGGLVSAVLRLEPQA
ncbi:type II secretion system protein GspM [Pararhodobacter sp.]|uniref:type II secretion system protein GspM n=1 Tax=Pararhodobacter sp. TaxID=2127056 RepID=UPI002B003274|nr:type II secretion system protein GspM [Pararhodobacter sp.]